MTSRGEKALLRILGEDVPEDVIDVPPVKENPLANIPKGEITKARTELYSHKYNDGRYFKLGNPGKPKGAVSAQAKIKMAYFKAFEKLGGVDGLVKWAKHDKNTRAKFYDMILRLLPREIMAGMEKTDSEGKTTQYRIALIVDGEVRMEGEG